MAEPAACNVARSVAPVIGTVPASFSTDDYSRLEAEMRTRCGAKRIPLSTQAVEGRADPVFSFDTGNEAFASSTFVWSELSSDSKVMLGQAPINSGMYPRVITGLSCAPKHSVTIEGNDVCELTMTSEALVGVFIPKGAHTCYAVTVANFSKDGGGAHITYLQGKAAYPFPNTKLDYKFKPMPKTLSVNKNTYGATKVAIEEISCETVPEHKQP